MEYLSRIPAFPAGRWLRHFVDFLFIGGIEMITLCGGKQVESYDNRACKVCGKELRGAVVCRRHRGNICQEHCESCPWYIPYMQNCQYKRRTP